MPDHDYLTIHIYILHFDIHYFTHSQSTAITQLDHQFMFGIGIASNELLDFLSR